MSKPMENIKMKTILFYGAGVLGSLYAGLLSQTGCDVTLLARGERLRELRERGLLLAEDGRDITARVPVKLTERLDPEDAYDLVLVIVRKNQLASLLPALAQNHGTPNLLFLVNNAEGPEALIQAMVRERVLLGFPGADGRRQDGVVHYCITPGWLQATTIGELDGRRSERIEWIEAALRRAGFPVAICPNMNAWLKTHAMVVSSVANAIYLAGGSNYRLAHTPDGLLLMARAVKEGLHVLSALRIPITPAKYRALRWLPEPILLAGLRLGFDTPQAELVLARHANVARDEMQVIADECAALARQSALPTPAIDAVARYIDPVIEPALEGQSKLNPSWGSTIALAGTLLSTALLLTWLVRKRR